MAHFIDGKHDDLLLNIMIFQSKTVQLPEGPGSSWTLLSFQADNTALTLPDPDGGSINRTHVAFTLS